MKKLKGFTLAETLVTLSVIGVIAVLTVATLGNKIDRNKAMFKKAYSITERTVVELVNDETYYPYNHDKFGFLEDTDVKIIGTDYYTDTRDPRTPKTNRSSNGKVESITGKFCNLFSNNLSTLAVIDNKNTARSRSCQFMTTDGIFWSIARNSNPQVDGVNGFVILIDTNGTDSQPNQPKAIGDIGTMHAVKNRDRFFILVRADGKISIPNNDITAQNYVRANNFNVEN